MDPDIFAVIIPTDRRNLARMSFQLSANRRLYTSGAPTMPSPHRYGSESPDSEVPDSGDESEDDEQNHLSDLDRITLRLSQKLVNPLEGFQFGTSRDSDVCLIRDEACKAPSRRQFSIVMDDQYGIWLRDYTSSRGTAVKYDDNDRAETRRNETWILSYHPGHSISFEILAIHAGKMSFQIYFPNHHMRQPSSEYLANLDTFCRLRRNAMPAINHLGLNTGSAITTTANSSQVSRDRRPIYIPHYALGHGGFGTVTAVISARDGRLFAMKRFSNRGDINMFALTRNIERRLDDTDYANFTDRSRHEFRIAEGLQHPNIMPMLDFFHDSEGPVLLMPLYEHGSIKSFAQDKGAFGIEECFMLLLGLLKAMSFLHGKGIVHRDIKAENIMVELNPFNIVLADFGLATEASCHTFAGTVHYMAPEIFSPGTNGYSHKADVWSAAVTILVCYFPEYSTPKSYPQGRTPAAYNWSRDWAEELVRMLMTGHLTRSEIQGQDVLCGILYNMLEAEPNDRHSAREALEEGCIRSAFSRTPEGDYTLGPSIARRLSQGVYTPTTESPLATQIEAVRSASQSRQQSPSLHPQRLPTTSPTSHATVVPANKTVLPYPSDTPVYAEMPRPSRELDEPQDYVINHGSQIRYFGTAPVADCRATSEPPSYTVRPDYPRRQQDIGYHTLHQLDRAGQSQLSNLRNIPRGAEQQSKTDHHYPNTRSAAAARRYMIAETSYGEPNIQYTPYRTSQSEQREKNNLPGISSVERRVLQLKEAYSGK